MKAFLIVPMFLFCCCEMSEVIAEEVCQLDPCEFLITVGAMEARLKVAERQLASLQTGTGGPLGPVGDACVSNPCPRGSKCATNPVNGKAVCTCPSGYTGSACNVDINECTLGANPCEQGGHCLNTEGSFQCQCLRGYESPRCMPDQKLIEERELTSLQTKFDDLQNRYNNLTDDRAQLQTRYNHIAQELDQLRTHFHQLQTTCNTNTATTVEQENLKRKQKCESGGFTPNGNHCYYISTWKATWEGARQDCIARQSNLIVVNSREKQNFVEGVNQYVWLGLSDRAVEGSFKWVDGTHLSYPTYWAPGQPDKLLGDGDCVVFLNVNGHHRGWHDADCQSPILYWICERVL